MHAGVMQRDMDWEKEQIRLFGQESIRIQTLSDQRHLAPLHHHPALASILSEYSRSISLKKNKKW
jgi:hypothetical protein